jgi:aspartate oxidase
VVNSQSETPSGPNARRQSSKLGAGSNTNYAQGGIAAVTSKEDSFESPVRDTLEAGAGLCKEAVVRAIVEEGPARVQELIELGMKFSERDVPGNHGTREQDLGSGRQQYQLRGREPGGCGVVR